MNSYEEIKYRNELIAIIISNHYSSPGVSFFTDSTLSQQVAYMQHPAGKQIDPHVHNPVRREVHYTQEVLVIKSGKLRVDFYSDDQVYQKSRILEAGDLILLIKGGHGFEVLEDLEMYEIKQGPYAGDADKTRFISAVAPKDINFD